MWADKVAPERASELRDQLLKILPAPQSSTASHRRSIASKAPLEQVAQLLNQEPGFVYLNSGPGGTALMSAPLVTISYRRGVATVQGPGGTGTLEAPAFDILEAAIQAWDSPAILAGFLGYDLAAELEEVGPLPEDEFDFPRLWIGLYDSFLTLGSDTGEWSLIWTDAWQDIQAPAWSEQRAEDVLRTASSRELPSPQVTASGEITSFPDAAGFQKAVANTVRTIHAGDIFQTNICRKLETALHGDQAWDLFRKLRAESPARYEAFLRIGDPAEGKSLLSISPEAYLKVEETAAQTDPIKGTRPRGADPQEDQALIDELLSSEKDRAELAMIVDVSRNDLGRVSEIGSIRVAVHAELMTLPTVHHSVSTVRGHLLSDASLVDLLRASFPAASISGAPKIEAIRVALREEKQLRGPCMGAIGWMSLGEDKSMEMSVAIRTAFVTDGVVRYYAGCGITADSDPAAEFEESSHKAAAFLRALGLK